jgi:hypothetical protein
MRTVVLLTLVPAVVAAGAATAIVSLDPATVVASSSQQPTISIEELHCQFHMRSLPELEIHDLY